nr:glutamate-cysteine ligase family protein [Goodfellowiella coeruleoviolacea]
MRDVVATEPAPVRLRSRAAAEAYVASICFKHGPPRLFGVELEWTVHHATDPSRPLEATHLAAALGPHAPPTLNPDSPHRPLPSGSPLTVEPGGQVEISPPPRAHLAELLRATAEDIGHVTDLLRPAGLVLGERGADAHRPPRRLLRVPRYDAMEAAFDALGPDGRLMMCATAGLQVCVDAGERGGFARRWAAVHALGPVLGALFANSPGIAGQRADWASARLRACYGTDPARSRPCAVTADPAADWARRVLDTPLLLRRRPGGDWRVPRGVSFADWLAGALPEPPTTADLDYHLTTMFPPVRPHGYLEIRYLDTPRPGRWVAPVALLVALLGTEQRVDQVLAATEPVARRWLHAARFGLADPPLARAAAAVVELGCQALPETGIGAALAESVAEDLNRTLATSTR